MADYTSESLNVHLEHLTKEQGSYQRYWGVSQNSSQFEEGLKGQKRNNKLKYTKCLRFMSSYHTRNEDKANLSPLKDTSELNYLENCS